MSTITALPSHQCDFCSQPLADEYTAFNCNDFTYKHLRGIDLNSSGAWHACRTCGDMIEAANWYGLHHRSVDSFIVKYPDMDRWQVKAAIYDLHELFRREWKRT